MTRTVAIGAVLGFVVTVIAASLFERSTRAPVAEMVDAGPKLIPIAPQFIKMVTVPDRVVDHVLVDPNLAGFLDAGSP